MFGPWQFGVHSGHPDCDVLLVTVGENTRCRSQELDVFDGQPGFFHDFSPSTGLEALAMLKMSARMRDKAWDMRRSAKQLHMTYTATKYTPDPWLPFLFPIRISLFVSLLNTKTPRPTAGRDMMTVVPESEGWVPMLTDVSQEVEI